MTKTNRLIALLVSIVMIISMLTVCAFATEPTEQGTTAPTEQGTTAPTQNQVLSYATTNREGYREPRSRS